MTLELNLQRGLVGHWTMDDKDIDNNICRDKSANDRNADVSRPSTNISSPIGEAVRADGASNQVVILENSEDLDGFDEMTISYWCKSRQDQQGDYAWPVEKGGFSGSPFYFADESSGGANFRIRSPNNTYNNSPPIIFDEWNFYTITFKRNDVAEWWHDAELDSDEATADEPLNDNNNNIELMASGNADANMDISEFRIYNRALSESEISALYNMRSQRNTNI